MTRRIDLQPPRRGCTLRPRRCLFALVVIASWSVLSAQCGSQGNGSFVGCVNCQTMVQRLPGRHSLMIPGVSLRKVVISIRKFLVLLDSLLQMPDGRGVSSGRQIQ